MIDPKAVAEAKAWDVGLDEARLIMRGLRQAGRTPETRRGPGGRRRTTPTPLREAILGYIKARPDMTRAEMKDARLQIAKDFHISTRTLGRHAQDLMDKM